MPELKRAAAAILAVHVIAGLIFLAPSYVRPDSVGVYAYLRSAVVDHDLLFFDEWAGFGMLGPGFAYFKEVTPAGALANHWWIGASVLSAPFYVASHLISIAVPGRAMPDDGFFGVDLATLAWASVLFGALALSLAWQSLSELQREHFDPFHAAIALLLTGFGTPFFWQVFRAPLGTHAAGMLAVGAVTLLCLRHLHDDKPPPAFLLGLAFGVAIITRLQHVVLLPAILYSGTRIRRPSRFWTSLVLGVLLPCAIQGVAWWQIYGTPLGPITAGANLEGVTWMPFQRMALLPVLVSPWHGLFAWSPVALLAVAGWLLLVRSPEQRERRFGIALMLMFTGELFANSFFDRYWWGGMSFGPRRFVDLAAPIAIGIAICFRGRFRVAAIVSGIAATAWSLALTKAAMAGTINLSRYVSFSELQDGVIRAQSAFKLEMLRSAITTPGLFVQSAIAILVVAAVVSLLLRLTRGGAPQVASVAAIWISISLLAVLATWIPTRGRAAEERRRFGLDTAAARSAGPLIDQRGLLGDELQWLESTGQKDEAARTANEIGAIDAELKRLESGR